MTTATYPLGRPRPAAKRGGDCRARDLNQGRNVHGGHRFAATTHARINNGLLRLTVGATGAAPSLTVEARRGRLVVGDVYEDVYVDLYGGSYSAPAWFAMGTITIDSPSVSALLTQVRIARISPESVTLQLVAPLMADAFVTLRRGERMVRIQHGSTRSPTVATTRRVRWTASPSPTGTATGARVEETTAAVDGFFRFVACQGSATADAGAFSVTTSSLTTATFAAGVGTSDFGDRPADYHADLKDSSRVRLVIS